MTISDRKEREKRLRRQSILKSAKKLIAKSGCEEMSMNQLAAATELNKATLYLYYSNKDDLIDAIVYEGLKVLEKRLEESDDRSETGLERVLNQIRTTFAFYRESPVYFYTFNHQERRPSGLRKEGPFAEKGNEIASRVFGRTLAAVESGIKQHDIRDDIDINTFLILMFAHVYGAMHIIYAKKDIYEDMQNIDADTIERAAIECLQYYLEVKK